MSDSEAMPPNGASEQAHLLSDPEPAPYKGKRKRRVIRRRKDSRARRQKPLDNLLQSWDVHWIRLGVQAAGALAAVAIIVWIARLQTDAEVRLASGPPAGSSTAAESVPLHDGMTLLAIRGDGRVEGLESLAPADSQKVRQALASQKIDAPALLRPLLHHKTVVPGPRESLAMAALHSPVWTATISDQPTLRWSPIPDAVTYRVHIYGDGTELQTSPPILVTNWTPPRALPRDRTYAWRITAHAGPQGDGETLATPEAWFMVVGTVEARRVDQLRILYQGRRLTLGVLYAEAGFRQEAETELHALLNANPAAQVAQKLLRSVQEW